MLEVVLANKFKKDLKIIAKRNYNLNMLDEIVEKLANHEKLPERNYDHNLEGEYNEYRECHILSDWILIYRADYNDNLLFLFRTGTHSDLFS